MAYERITKGTKKYPYGRRSDGIAKKKPGRKTDAQRAAKSRRK